MYLENCDVLVIGGGFYGLYIAEYFSLKGFTVILCEKESDLMMRASYVNQARVHNGYHYPRSVLTALRSRVSFPRFCKEFKPAICNNFDSYYLIGKVLGKVTARQFMAFTQRIGAPCKKASGEIDDLFNEENIEGAFFTTEYGFDTKVLMGIMKQRVRDAGVKVCLNTLVEKIEEENDKLVAFIKTTDGTVQRIDSRQIFNCTYSQLNTIITASNLHAIPLKHELTEMCLVEVPDELKGKSFTVMCGPFFSLMPFPSTPYYSFSHVRYTPHYEWYDKDSAVVINAHRHMESIRPKSAFNKMKKDAQKYMPLITKCKYKKSLWEVKTVLPSSEGDDSRPILFKSNYKIKGLHCIIGGKIDNVYDAINLISSMGLDRK